MNRATALVGVILVLVAFAGNLTGFWWLGLAAAFFAGLSGLAFYVSGILATAAWFLELIIAPEVLAKSKPGCYHRRISRSWVYPELSWSPARLCFWFATKRTWTQPEKYSAAKSSSLSLCCSKTRPYE
jgi:hypothetical protein